MQGVYFPCFHSFWGSWAPPLERSTLVSLTMAGQYYCFYVLLGRSGEAFWRCLWKMSQGSKSNHYLCEGYCCRQFDGKHFGIFSFRIPVWICRMGITILRIRFVNKVTYFDEFHIFNKSVACSRLKWKIDLLFSK